MVRAVVLILVLGVFISFAVSALAADAPSFKLGFKALADQIPEVAGSPTEEEHYGANGDSLQQTTRGLMAWRKADNWTAFTNGSITWVNGPNGVQSRPNDVRFDWEKDAPPPATTPEDPVFVETAPSDYDIVRAESAETREDGARVFVETLANRNHYWRAAEIEVRVAVRDAGGRLVMTGIASSAVSSLGPQQSGRWEFPIPRGFDGVSVSGEVVFRWIAPGR